MVSKNNIVNGYFGTIVLLPHCMAKVEYEGLGSPSTIFQSIDGIKKLSCCFLFCFLCDEAGFVTSVLVLFGQGCPKTLLSKVFSFSFQACSTKVFLLLKFFDQFLTVSFFKCSVSYIVAFSKQNKAKLQIPILCVKKKQMFFWIVLPKKNFFGPRKKNFF